MGYGEAGGFDIFKGDQGPKLVQRVNTLTVESHQLKEHMEEFASSNLARPFACLHCK